MFSATTQASKDTKEERRRVPSYDKSIQGHPRRKEGEERKERKKEERKRKRKGEERKVVKIIHRFKFHWAAEKVLVDERRNGWGCCKKWPMCGMST